MRTAMLHLTTSVALIEEGLNMQKHQFGYTSSPGRHDRAAIAAAAGKRLGKGDDGRLG